MEERLAAALSLPNCAQFVGDADSANVAMMDGAAAVGLLAKNNDQRIALA